MSKKFTIFGNPVQHSISPQMHTAIINGLGLDATYTKTKIIDGKKIKELFLKSFDGANVTIPHKEVAYHLCDEVVGVAKSIKAVNTLVKKNSKMVGYNTDAEGFLESIKDFKNIKKALIFGAGGSAKAISIILSQNGIEPHILNRSNNRFDFFHSHGIECMSWKQFHLSKYDLVINTTSAGLTEDIYPIDEKILKDIFLNTKYAVDIIYNKKTPFLKLADNLNIPYKDGADMLMYQGILAFNLFYDNRFDINDIKRFAKKTFSLL